MIEILQWNIRSVATNKHWLYHSFFSRAQVIALQESFLKPNIPFSLKGYQTFRHDRTDRVGGGVLTLVRNDIPARQVSQPVDITSSTESICVELHLHSTTLYIINIYSPTGLVDTNWLDSILTSLPRPFLLIGDFNIDISKPNKRRTAAFLDWINAQNLHILNHNNHTRTGSASQTSLIDLTICSPDIVLNSTIFVHPDTFDSDHHPIITSLLFSFTQHRTNYTKKYIRWNKVRKDVNQLCQSDINFTSGVFQHCCHQILEANTIQVDWSTNTTFPPYWDESCSRLLGRKRMLARKAKQLISPQLWTEHKRAAAQLKKHIKIKARGFWNNKCQQVSRDGHMFRLVNNLVRRNKPARDSLFVKHNHVIASIATQAEEFLSLFLRRQDLPGLPYTLSNADDYVNRHFELADLIHIIANLKDSSPGTDGIPAKLYRQLNPLSTQMLLDVFNDHLDSGSVPPSWTTAIIIPIKKPNKPNNEFNSYRPIALTDIGSKIFERLLLKRITHHLICNNILHDDHHGFMPKRGCAGVVTALQQDIAEARRLHKIILLATLDIKGAYDSIWIPGLLFKCASIGLGGKIGKWLESFLTERHLQVKWQGQFSSRGTSYTGVPQGGVLSAILFTIYLYDIFEVLRPGVRMKIYADDIFLYVIGDDPAQTRTLLQEVIQDILRWCSYWQLEISVDKCTAINFSRSCQKISPLSIGSHIVPWSRQVKVLGFWLNTQLNLKTHILHIKNKAATQVNILRSICGQDWGISSHHALQFTNATIRSLLEYMSPLLNLANITEQKSIDIILNKALRAATHLPLSTPIPLLRKVTNQPNIIPRIKYLSHKQMVAQMASRTFASYGQYLYARSDPNADFDRTILHSLNQFLLYIDITPDHIMINPWLEDSQTQNNYRIITTGLSFQDKSLPISCIKGLWEEYVAQELQNHSIIATDASKDDIKTSIACIDVFSDRSQAWLIHQYNSIFTAESMALEKAIHSYVNKSGNYAVISDSQASLNALDNVNIHSPTSTRHLRHTILQKTSSINCHIVFIWVPGHANIAQNMQADQLAKFGPFSPIVINSVDCFDLFKKMRHYQSDTDNYIWLNSDYSDQFNYLQDSNLSAITSLHIHKQQEAILLRWLTCQIVTNSFLHKIHKRNDPLCDFCHIPDTAHHVLLNCHQYSQQRSILFRVLGVTNVSYGRVMSAALKSHKTASALCTFTCSLPHYS